MILKINNYLLVLMCMFYSFIGHAHDPNKAYFKIEETGGNIVVLADFPWSIRKVIDNIKTHEGENNGLEVKLFKYIKEHVVLEKKNGDKLPMLNIELLKNRKEEQHHSTANYKIIFKGNQFYKITNTLMCDYYKDQLNYHVLFDQSDFKITSAKNPSFVIEPPFLKSKLLYIIGAFLVFIVGVFIFYKLVKKNIKLE